MDSYDRWPKSDGIVCATCGGEGEIVVEWSTDNEHGQDTEECPDCGGCGWLESPEWE